MPFWMGGEAGSVTLHRSGHAYLQIKDDKSQIRACYFGGAAECRKLGIDNGSLVEVWGNLSVYEVRGEYQFNIKKIRLAGIGALQQRFEELKRKLEAEGLFDPAVKKPIPLLPRSIGVVSSPTGAAIRDFLQIINRRFPDVNIKIFPALVQGAQASRQVAAGVDFFNRTRNVDVIVVTRGGGSMEDLWPFNSELLARSIAASNIPVISAIGHEIDFTICDFVADLRVPTPSAAAELAVFEYRLFEASLAEFHADMTHAMLRMIYRARMRAETVGEKLLRVGPAGALKEQKVKLFHIGERLSHRMEQMVLTRKHRLELLAGRLHAVSPAARLSGGYTFVTTKENRPLKSVKDVAIQDTVKVSLADGAFTARVEQIEEL